MYCTALYLKKRTVSRCLSVLLLIALLLQCAFPFPAVERAVWDETLVRWPSKRRPRRKRCYRTFLAQRSKVLLCRVGLVAVLLLWSGWPQQQSWCWLLLSVPIADAWLSLLLLWWPRVAQRRSYLYLVRGMHQFYLIVLILLFSAGLNSQPSGGAHLMLISGGVKIADGAQAQGWIEEDGTWHLHLEGSIHITCKPQNEFEKRAWLMMFRQIRSPHTPKRPFLRQTWLAEWFGTRQELISRWEGYVRQGGLLKLQGEAEPWVLTPHIRTAILDIWIPNFWLSAGQVRERLVAAGHIASPEQISESNIYRVAQESGFAQVRSQLRKMFRFTADGPQWRDEVLIERLFELNETLITRLETGKGLTRQLTLEVEALRQALGAPMTPLKKPLPFAYRLQQAIFGQWQDLEDDKVHCPHCGSSSLVARKGNKPRCKKYRNPQTGEWEETMGYRYYCRNPVCPFDTFTDYPEGVRLHSCWTVETVIWGVMVYMQMRTTYRRAAQAVGVSHVTLWRWAMLIGQQSLPVAKLFGVVRCSGVVGVDEKWVLVPKNDKPAGKRNRWMYVYLAVDVYTYDLLHIDIYPYNGKDEARAFLQALKAKGYQPQVIITDMNQDYSQPIREVFPQAQHHECLFHALQRAQRLIKEVYGNDYPQTHPEALDLKQHIYKIFDAKTKRTVDKRYRKVMALESQFVTQMSEAERIFDFLERHYPKLVKAVGNPLTPLTNNTVELVIRRFDQHYQNMCGFDSIETARTYLNLFELAYRFTPFCRDNRPVKGRKLDIRGKCPLELAGYDVSQIPIARILRGQLLGWPPETFRELVPNA